MSSEPSPALALPDSLVEALRRSREWGFLGDGPLEVHIDHAHGFARAVASLGGTGGSSRDRALAGPWMDLGSGGGIPGLILAHLWPDRPAVLLDSNDRRTTFLAQVIQEQEWGNRVRVVSQRAEVAGREEALRGGFSLVVARSFGSPPVTAECAAPFLVPDGILVVSEPPGSATGHASDQERWPPDGLAKVGMAPLSAWRDGFGYQLLRQLTECPDGFPRRVGVPAKRPLYRLG